MTMSLRALERRCWKQLYLLRTVKKDRSHPIKDDYGYRSSLEQLSFDKVQLESVGRLPRGSVQDVKQMMSYRHDSPVV